MEKPVMAGRDPQTETAPVLLALPQWRAAAEGEPCEEKQQGGEPELELLQTIEMGSSPRVELTLLRELLHRSPGLLANLADPAEVHNYHGPLAGASAYKHRLQAIRCEYLNARIRAEDLEVELKEAHYTMGRLEKHIAYLQSTLDQMQASRGWKLVEKCSRLRRTVSGFFRRVLAAAKGG